MEKMAGWDECALGHDGVEGVWVEMILPGGDWLARGRIVAAPDGPPVVVELRVTPVKDAVPKNGITQQVVRRVPLGTFAPFSVSASKSGDKSTDVVARPRPRPRRAAGLDDRFYARLAREYLALLAQGSRAPIEDLAAEKGEAVSRIRDRVHEARVRGLLSRSESGRKGGVLLPQALKLLE